MPAIVAEGLHKSYDGRAALRGASLAVDRGAVFALVGPNGAGKTTMVRCLCGTTAPDAGTVELLGGPPRAVDRSRIGLLPQDYSPPDRLTARELIGYHAGLYERARDVEGVLDAVGLEGAADTRYAALSGGQRRRSLVGTALVNDPDVLFLDEPTTGIDPAGRRTVWAIVEELAASGTTVFLTTHDMGEVERLADRVGVIVRGDLAAVASTAALIDSHGGPPTLSVETDASEVDLPYPVDRTERGLVVEGVTPRDIGDVIDALDAAGASYDALSWREPDLETAYLSLTGEPPRTAERSRQEAPS